MRNVKLERMIIKIDNDIAALSIAKRYLTNLEEINEVRDTLNNKRQVLANELYVDDKKSYLECCATMIEMLDKELEKDEQVELLELIKDKFGRQAPNASKNSSGLNAWLKEMAVEYDWINDVETGWDKLVITGFAQYK